MALNDDLGGPFHVYLQNEFGKVYDRLNEVQTTVTEVGAIMKERAIESIRMEARVTDHIANDEKMFGKISDDLNAIRTDTIERKASWKGPRELLLWIAVVATPILSLVIAAWNPFVKVAASP